MGNTEISYHHKDIIFKSLTEIFANQVLDFYDINTAAIVRAEPANLPTIAVIAVQEKTMDFVFYLADDSYLHLEFQSTQGPEELERFMEYDVALYRKHHKTIHTYIVYGAGISDAPEVLNCGSIEYRAKGIFMDRYDGDQLFAALGLKIRSGASLYELERMQLAFLPLMKSSHSKQERAVETIELAGLILDETEKTFLTGCVIAISDNFIDREYTQKILEVLRMSKVLRALEEEAKDEGRMEGLEAMRLAAKKLQLKGMSIVEIAEITGLPIEEIQKLSGLS
ncbi:MAG: hypothetical protein WA125_04595 [Desulfosporosinus sp.]